MAYEDSHKLSVAPMMAVTDRHFRGLFRQLSRRAKLYTEMYVDQTLIHQREHLWYYLGHDAAESPLAVQLGGNDPCLLGEAAEACEAWNFSEINLNCGCPSPKVSGRCFGARLMLDPENVRKITSGMIRRVTRTPVTVKCRIGVDDNDSYEELVKFVVAVRSAGVDHVIVHARKCWLKGLSPAANRTIPPLQYGVVHRLSSEFPELEIVLNGGVTTLGLTRREIIYNYLDQLDFYMEEHREDRARTLVNAGREQISTGTILKPISFLSSGFRGSRKFRHELSLMQQNTPRLDPEADDLREMVCNALDKLPGEILDEPVGDLLEGVA